MYDKLKALLGEMKQRKGIGAPQPRPIIFRFVKPDPTGAPSTETTDRFLLRADGVYRLPNEAEGDEPNEDE